MKYMEELNDDEYLTWQADMIHDNSLFIELSRKHEKAYCLRILAKG